MLDEQIGRMLVLVIPQRDTINNTDDFLYHIESLNYVYSYMYFVRSDNSDVKRGRKDVSVARSYSTLQPYKYPP